VSFSENFEVNSMRLVVTASGVTVLNHKDVRLYDDLKNAVINLL
jgi:hypothetical protein